MSKNRIIVIPCAAGPGQSQDSVIGLVNFDHFIYRLPYFENEEVRKQNSKIVHGILRFLHTPSSAYSNIIANIFSYNAKYPIDKLSIAINLCRLLIAVKECAPTNDDTCLDVLTLALAAGDGTVLTTRGEQLQLGYKTGQVSWCRRPDEGGWNVYGLDDVECREVAETMACALDCGHRWMINAWPRIACEVGDEIDLKWGRVKHLSQDIFEILFPDAINPISDNEEHQAYTEVLLRFIACILRFGKFWEVGTSISVNPSGDFAMSDL
ncbi:uncharacterized protein Z519_09229 [Cladophialophora bantiana CBS 173.52]|uniref:Uncharacterized protein n=1 Tax=Cladophialophora bantiana (strain ATCC 10958 / CBS 173.52 / CDC B-1940 / NIH 8579) TaxID=1442370 RepID=A0A0D2HG68_CLAB1|nr:uncharacterized protein Z519_09229 [Cladophialophora bantiana CBS 173.52]KIW89800.1 hypothetical protein Z519_09229 [Cladophialophora bantiana CBS 173.52]